MSNPNAPSTTSDAKTDSMPLKANIKNINKRCAFDLALNAVVKRCINGFSFLLRSLFIITKFLKCVTRTGPCETLIDRPYTAVRLSEVKTSSALP